jgi:hypothetical protein
LHSIIKTLPDGVPIRQGLCGKRGRKPSSVVERSSVCPGRCRTGVAIALEARRAAVSPQIGSCIGWGLHRAAVAGARVSSCLAFPSLPETEGFTGKPWYFGRFLSVALSLKSPSPAVNRHPALRCSDFPHGKPCDRLAALSQVQDSIFREVCQFPAASG